MLRGGCLVAVSKNVRQSISSNEKIIIALDGLGFWLFDFARRLALLFHPDKNKGQNEEEALRGSLGWAKSCFLVFVASVFWLIFPHELRIPELLARTGFCEKPT